METNEQKVAFIREWYAKGWISYKELLRLLELYEYNQNT